VCVCLIVCLPQCCVSIFSVCVCVSVCVSLPPRCVHGSLDANDFDVDTNINMTGTGGEMDLNGNILRLDADGDTFLTLSTDDQIKFTIASVTDALRITNDGGAGAISWPLSGFEHVIRASSTKMIFEPGVNTDSVQFLFTDADKTMDWTDNHLITASQDLAWTFESTYDDQTPALGTTMALYQWNYPDAASNLEVFAQMEVDADVIVNGSEDGRIKFSVMDAGTLKSMFEIGADDVTVTSNGFQFVTNVDIEMNSNDLDNFANLNRDSPTSITGSRGGNAALASLLTDLASIGLITDGTSA